MPQTVEVLRRQQSFSFGTHLRNQILADEWRGHAKLVFAAVVVLTHLLQLGGVCHTIPTPIVTPVAGTQFVVCSRNWIAERLKLIA